MSVHASHWLAAIRQAVRGLGAECTEVRAIYKSGRTVIQLLSDHGVLAQTTIWPTPNAAPGVDDRQLLLPSVVTGPAFVRFTLRDGAETEPSWERLGDAVLAWTWDGAEESRLKTIVPAAFADQVREMVGVTIVAEDPSDGPSHLLRKGDMVAVEATPRPVLGSLEDDGGNVGVVVDIDGTPRLAWLDGAAEENGRIRLWTSAQYVVELRPSGTWSYRVSPAAKASKKSRAPKGAEV